MNTKIEQKILDPNSSVEGRAKGVSLSLLRPVKSLTANKKFSAVSRKLNFASQLYALNSEKISGDRYFARLVISEWEQLEGRFFRLECKGQHVYGNVVESPEEGFELEYRNIVAPSDNCDDYQLVILDSEENFDSRFTLEFSKRMFTTEEQLRYDERFSIKSRNNIHFSERGNLKNPKKIIFTFPGFGTSTGRIQYSLSYLQQLRDEDLTETALIAFQDRYLCGGSYMLFDSSGNSLLEPIKAFIRQKIEKYGLSDSDVLFFGASKGATSAIYFAKEFPQTTLLLSTPQLNLPAYFTKAAFRENLYRNQNFHTIEQASELLKQYFSEGRKIHFFYTNNDELSNQSYVEFPINANNLYIYRFSGVHTAVARKALPTMLAIMRSFNGKESSVPEEILPPTFATSSRIAGRIAIDSELTKTAYSINTNWYVVTKNGGATYHYELSILSAHRHLFTSAEQEFNLSVDALPNKFQLEQYSSAGLERYCSVQLVSELPAGSPVDYSAATADLNFSTDSVQSYRMFDRFSVEIFKLKVARAMHGNPLNVVLTDSLSNLQGLEGIPADESVVLLQYTDEIKLLPQFLVRLMSRFSARELRVFAAPNIIDAASLQEIKNGIQWHQLQAGLLEA